MQRNDTLEKLFKIEKKIWNLYKNINQSHTFLLEAKDNNHFWSIFLPLLMEEKEYLHHLNLTKEEVLEMIEELHFEENTKEEFQKEERTRNRKYLFSRDTFSYMVQRLFQQTSGKDPFYIQAKGMLELKREYKEHPIVRRMMHRILTSYYEKQENQPLQAEEKTDMYLKKITAFQNKAERENDIGLILEQIELTKDIQFLLFLMHVSTKESFTKEQMHLFKIGMLYSNPALEEYIIKNGILETKNFSMLRFPMLADSLHIYLLLEEITEDICSILANMQKIEDKDLDGPFSFLYTLTTQYLLSQKDYLETYEVDIESIGKVTQDTFTNLNQEQIKNKLLEVFAQSSKVLTHKKDSKRVTK
ncbi:MAG: hypothetical protein PHN72_03260 [Bacilli bacterium]|nr:hypothetical protein [Bacilli bacterium]